MVISIKEYHNSLTTDYGRSFQSIILSFFQTETWWASPFSHFIYAASLTKELDEEKEFEGILRLLLVEEKADLVENGFVLDTYPEIHSMVSLVILLSIHKFSNYSEKRLIEVRSTSGRVVARVEVPE